MEIKANLKELDIFRIATEEDIVVGKIVFVIGDSDRIHKKLIQEVLRPSDPWKAFSADDGCRYGLEDLFVLKSNSDLLEENDDLKHRIKHIQEIASRANI